MEKPEERLPPQPELVEALEEGEDEDEPRPPQLLFAEFVPVDVKEPPKPFLLLRLPSDLLLNLEKKPWLAVFC